MTAVYSVVDIETTGLHRTDRIVEVAVISADGSGRPVKVWETLVNPERRPGPTHVHGIEPTECAKAPSFRQIARDLHDRLTGSVLIGHNLQFDWCICEPSSLAVASPSCAKALVNARQNGAGRWGSHLVLMQRALRTDCSNVRSIPRATTRRARGCYGRPCESESPARTKDHR